jgi:hypothetical protein
LSAGPALFDAGLPVAIDDRPRGVAGESVTIRHTRDHAYVKREKRGCGLCGKGKRDMVHMGTPPSLNAFSAASESGRNRYIYLGWKKNWSAALDELLADAGLAKPLAHVHVDGLMCFPDRRERDQGNFRVLLEKALGDVLVDGGWLPDDSWSYYEFGNLRRTYAKGEAWTQVTLVPTLPS